jgi:hypothetical protein
MHSPHEARAEKCAIDVHAIWEIDALARKRAGCFGTPLLWSRTQLQWLACNSKRGAACIRDSWFTSSSWFNPLAVLAKDPEPFTYDHDGNLKTDSGWKYN